MAEKSKARILRVDFVIILQLPNVESSGKSRSHRRPSAISLVSYLSVYICSFLPQSAGREKVIFKKIHLLVFMQTLFSPSVGWAMWLKQTQMLPTDPGFFLMKKQGCREMCWRWLKRLLEGHESSSVRQPAAFNREKVIAWSPELCGFIWVCYTIFTSLPNFCYRILWQ